MLSGKLIGSVREAISPCGLRDGMTVSFHHHLRNGDYVLNMVMRAIAEMGLRNITVSASSIHEVHREIIPLIERGVITGIDTNYISASVSAAISAGQLAAPVTFRTHGGRPDALSTGQAHIDVAFIAAPAADCMGNLNGVDGPSACGSLGYAFADAQAADQVVVITDHLVPYPLSRVSISECYVNYVVQVDCIGDAKGIASQTTQLTRDPVALQIAKTAADVIACSGLLQDGFSVQTGTGGASLAVTKYLEDHILRRRIQGSFALGGITGYMVDMLERGLFRELKDVQCFDLRAVESIRSNPQHQEISARNYASSLSPSCVASSLDCVILGATEMDVNFNVNVHTDSNGRIIGGSGGHSDVAAGAKCSIIVAPLYRSRTSTVVEQVTCVSTPGTDVDVLVTQRGVAVNPRWPELAQRLKEGGIQVVDIHDLRRLCVDRCGEGRRAVCTDHVVDRVLSRNNQLQEHICAVVPGR